MQTVQLDHGVIDLVRREVRRDEEVYRLTSTEHRLITYLVSRPDTLVTTEELLVEVWGYKASCRTRAVSHAILRLRRKLERNPAQPVHLQTEYGEGYRWRAAAVPQTGPVENVPLVDPPTLSCSLPQERDDFVGRDETIATLTEKLAAGVRMTTVLGMGGVGKTRLVTRLGHLQRAHWAGGVWFCDLSEARERGHASAMGRMLGMRIGASDAVASIGAALNSRGRLLLVLDNVEQVVAFASRPSASGWTVRRPFTSSRPVDGASG